MHTKKKLFISQSLSISDSFLNKCASRHPPVSPAPKNPRVFFPIPPQVLKLDQNRSEETISSPDLFFFHQSKIVPRLLLFPPPPLLLSHPHSLPGQSFIKNIRTVQRQKLLCINQDKTMFSVRLFGQELYETYPSWGRALECHWRLSFALFFFLSLPSASPSPFSLAWATKKRLSSNQDTKEGLDAKK